MEPINVEMYDNWVQQEGGRPPLAPERRRYIPGDVYLDPDVRAYRLDLVVNSRSIRDPQNGRVIQFSDYLQRINEEWLERYHQELRICQGNWPHDVLQHPSPIRTLAWEIHQKLLLGQETWATLEFNLAVAYASWWLHEGNQHFVDFRLCNPYFGNVAERRARYSEEYRQTWERVFWIVNNRVRVIHLVTDHDHIADQLLLEIYLEWDRAFSQFQRVFREDFWNRLQRDEDRENAAQGRAVAVVVRNHAAAAVDSELDTVGEARQQRLPLLHDRQQQR